MLCCPPQQYDRPYEGKLIVTRGNEYDMTSLCPKTSLPITLGCAFLRQAKCEIVIADDDILKDAGWTFEIVKRHEEAHCGGWPNDPSRRKVAQE